MPEWFVYDRKGRKRKAKPEEIPKPLECGVSLEDGVPFTRKAGDGHGKKKQ